jgi:nucleoid-associated protein EbfC
MPSGIPPAFEDALKQAQAFAERLGRLKQEVAQRTVEASAGGGMVRAVADGAGRVREVRIEPQVVAAGDLEMLQDLVVAAVNQALAEARRLSKEALREASGGLPLGGLGDLLGGLGGPG